MLEFLQVVLINILFNTRDIITVLDKVSNHIIQSLSSMLAAKRRRRAVNVPRYNVMHLGVDAIMLRKAGEGKFARVNCVHSVHVRG